MPNFFLPDYILIAVSCHYKSAGQKLLHKWPINKMKIFPLFAIIKANISRVNRINLT